MRGNCLYEDDVCAGLDGGTTCVGAAAVGQPCGPRGNCLYEDDVCAGA
ncbi:MAG: hypothetical protein IT380_04090 [Myxococcales bacterium]|nr:hypothetical protein [Myxococcales bacterium]